MGKQRIVDLETELSHGTFVSTSTATQAGKTSEFPGLSRRFLPQRIPLSVLLDNHVDHLKKVLAVRDAGTHAVILRSAEDLFASQDRQQRLKSDRRSSPAFDAAGEVQLVAGKPLNAHEQVFAEQVGRLHAERTREKPDDRTS